MIGESNRKSDSTEQISTNSFSITTTLVAKLQKPYQQAVYLHCIEKWSYADIAKQLQLPAGTVKSHISRGIKMLREYALLDANSSSRDMPERKQSEPIAISDLWVNTLPEPYRTVLWLHYIKKQSYSMIAQQLCLPVGTIKSQINRGMKLLRNMVFGAD